MSERKTLEDIIKEQGELAATLREKQDKAKAEAKARAEATKKAEEEKALALKERLSEIRILVDDVIIEVGTALQAAKLDLLVMPFEQEFTERDIPMHGMAQFSYTQAASVTQDNPVRVIVRFGWCPVNHQEDREQRSLWISGQREGRDSPHYQRIGFSRLSVDEIKWAIKTIIESFSK